MAVKKNLYISADLDFAEEQLSTWRAYIENNPIEGIKDRFDYKETKNGGVIKMCVQTAEAQIKCVQDTLAKYLQMLEVINKMREVEDKKSEFARGGTKVPARMRD